MVAQQGRLLTPTVLPPIFKVVVAYLHVIDQCETHRRTSVLSRVICPERVFDGVVKKTLRLLQNFR